METSPSTVSRELPTPFHYLTDIAQALLWHHLNFIGGCSTSSSGATHMVQGVPSPRLQRVSRKISTALRKLPCMLSIVSFGTHKAEWRRSLLEDWDQKALAGQWHVAWGFLLGLDGGNFG